MVSMLVGLAFCAFVPAARSSQFRIGGSFGIEAMALDAHGDAIVAVPIPTTRFSSAHALALDTARDDHLRSVRIVWPRRRSHASVKPEALARSDQLQHHRDVLSHDAEPSRARNHLASRR